MPKTIKIQGKRIGMGQSRVIEMEVTKSWTRNQTKIPVFVSRSEVEGPTLLMTGGVHGDEISGVAVVRDILRGGYNKPLIGTTICIPILNIFGFLGQTRDLPDGRDLNRMMPGSPNGSLASQLAYIYTTEIAPLADFVIDFHAGGRELENFPNIRCDFEKKDSLALARVFSAPYTVNSSTIPNSIREYYDQRGVTSILFEGGKSQSLNPDIIKDGVDGALRVMKHLGMRDKAPRGRKSVMLKDNTWLRSEFSGMYEYHARNGSKIAKGELLGTVTDPYAGFAENIYAPYDLYLYGLNTAPLVYKGDALYHVSPL